MKKVLLLLILFFLGLPVRSQTELTGSRKAVRISGDVLFVAAPVVCLTNILILQDWEGLKQGAFTGITTLGVSYALKFCIDKERPDGSNNNSFPSFHTGVTFASAAFLQKRYGWVWGAPAYAVASYVGWSRHYAKKHDWWDILAGAAIGTGAAYIYTRPFANKHKIALAPLATDKHIGFHALMTF